MSAKLSSRARAGFTLIEVAICIAIVGVLAAIAVPRMSVAADNARVAQTVGSQRALQDAIDFYTAEHDDRTPAENPDRSLTNSGVLFMRRLLERTDELGNLDIDGIYGPYLRSAPANPFNKLVTLRINGAPHGAGVAGWRFDTGRAVVKADDPDAPTRKTFNIVAAPAAE